MPHKFIDWKELIAKPNKLPKYQPMTPKEIHFVNFTTTNEVLNRLINLTKQVNEFIIQTKYDYKDGYSYTDPALIQILFNYNMTLQIILVDARYLNKFLDEDEYHYDWDYMQLGVQIRRLFSIILSPLNSIYSWTDIKSKLKNFANLDLFEHEHIHKIVTLNVCEMFKKWFFNDIASGKSVSDQIQDWTLETTIAFLTRKHLNTQISKCKLWGIGLFFQHDKERDEELLFQDIFAGNLLLAGEHRFFLTEFAVNECIAVHTILSILNNDCMKKKTSGMLHTWYGKM